MSCDSVLHHTVQYPYLFNKSLEYLYEARSVYPTYSHNVLMELIDFIGSLTDDG